MISPKNFSVSRGKGEIPMEEFPLFSAEFQAVSDVKAVPLPLLLII